MPEMVPIKPIPMYEGKYSVSSDGEVYSHNYYGHGKTKELKVGQDHDGYNQVILCVNSRKKSFKVHRLVALAFIPRIVGLDQINHKNGIKADNSVENLEWCTSLQNKKHGYRTGLYDNKGITNGQATHTDKEIIEIRGAYQSGVSYKVLMKKYGIKSHSHFYRIVNKKNWRHI